MGDFSLMGALYLGQLKMIDDFTDGLAENRARSQLLSDYNVLVARFNALVQDYERLDQHCSVIREGILLAQKNQQQDAADTAKLERENAQLRHEAAEMKRTNDAQQRKLDDTNDLLEMVTAVIARYDLWPALKYRKSFAK